MCEDQHVWSGKEFSQVRFWVIRIVLLVVSRSLRISTRMRDNRHMWCRSKFSKVNFVAIFPSTFSNELIFENIYRWYGTCSWGCSTERAGRNSQKSICYSSCDVKSLYCGLLRIFTSRRNAQLATEVTVYDIWYLNSCVCTLHGTLSCELTLRIFRSQLAAQLAT